jgi:hypothetical protein
MAIFGSIINTPALVPPYSVSFSELKILPRELINDVFPIFSDLLNIQSYLSRGGSTVDLPADDDFAGMVVEQLRTIQTRSLAARNKLAQFADTGEFPSD